MTDDRSARRAFTLVEILISLTLLASLFVLLGGLLSGMSKVARLAEDDSLRDREINFCFDLMRKELGEMILDRKRLDYDLISGDGFFSYTTTRPELLVRNSIPGGPRRVEWRYDAAAKTVVRRASMLAAGSSREGGTPVVTSFLEGLAAFEVYHFDGVQWLRMAGISEPVPATLAIAVRLVFASSNDSAEQRIYESAFILPNETFYEK